MVGRSVETSFDPQDPIRKPDDFFGRRTETRRILNFLRRNQSVSVIGPARIGKTSLLFYISTPSVFQEYGLPATGHLFIRIDCRELAQATEQQVFDYMGRAIRQPTELAVENKPVSRFADLQYLCRQVKSMGHSLTLMFDPFETLTTNTRLSRDFFNALRSLNHSPRVNVAYVTASERPLFELEREAPHVSGSPFFNIFTQFELESLDAQDSHRLARHCGEVAGVSLPSHIIEQIVSHTGGHPSHLRRISWQVIGLMQDHGGIWNQACEERLYQYFENLPG